MSTHEERVEKLREIVAERKRLVEAEADAVFALRAGNGGWSAGATWDDVAAILGVSRQAAMKKYAPMCEERGGPNSWAHRRRWDAGRSRS